MQINAYYNGEFTSRENIKIPLYDRAIFFGDGIYDAAIGCCGKIFMLDDHIERFFSNARAVDIPIFLEKHELKSILLYLASETAYECYFVYFQLTRFSEERIHACLNNDKSNLLITITPQELPNVNNELKLTIAKDLRHEMCNIKTLNLMPAVLASKKAAIIGCDETVLHRNGEVTECAHSNVHIISDSVLITHPLDNHILPGISRKHMLEVCNRLGIKTEERIFSVYELLKADEVLISSSSKLALPVKQIDYVEFPRKNSGIGKTICEEMLSDFIKFTKNGTTNC